jgi:hypothetical protein
MKVTSTLMTVAEYCDQMASKSIVVNRDYQRSPKRWPQAARSFLIDTVLHGYPVPKIILAQQTDLRTRKTVKEIVDGQQRSMAIFDFYANGFPVSGESPFAGRRFSDLEPQEQQAFLAYSLGVDIFTGADEQAIRQTFRRMNSYTVPLNPQEQRFATHQGRVKWFIYEQSEKYSEALKHLGVLGEKQIAAMQDGLLLTELAFALVDGIRTTNKKTLDRFYDEREEGFQEEGFVTECLGAAFDLIHQIPDIHGSALMKPHQFYCLALACAHAVTTVPSLTHLHRFPDGFEPAAATAGPAFGTLALALESEDVADALRPFIAASSRATNTGDNRSTRFQFCCLAIGAALPQ